MPAPSKFDPKLCRQAHALALLGLTDVQIANVFEIHKDTFYEWKKAHPEFAESLRRAKDTADAKVAKSLFRKACGYRMKVTKVFCHEGVITKAEYIERFAPDTGAIAFWLKNRQRALWRDRVDTEVTGKDGAPLESTITDTELARRIAFVLSQEVARKKSAMN